MMVMKSSTHRLKQLDHKGRTMRYMQEGFHRANQLVSQLQNACHVRACQWPRDGQTEQIYLEASAAPTDPLCGDERKLGVCVYLSPSPSHINTKQNSCHH